MNCPVCGAPTKYVYAEPARDYYLITCLNCGIDNDPWSALALTELGLTGTQHQRTAPTHEGPGEQRTKENANLPR